MGNARARGTYEQRKASPRGRVAAETPRETRFLIRSAQPPVNGERVKSADGRTYEYNGTSLVRVR